MPTLSVRWAKLAAYQKSCNWIRIMVNTTEYYLEYYQNYATGTMQTVHFITDDVHYFATLSLLAF